MKVIGHKTICQHLYKIFVWNLHFEDSTNWFSLILYKDISQIYSIAVICKMQEQLKSFIVFLSEKNIYLVSTPIKHMIIFSIYKRSAS